VANRIKLAGTTTDSFSIPVSDGSLSPTKIMDGISLSTEFAGGTIYLTVDSGPGFGNTGALWVNPNSPGTWLRLGNQNSLMQASDGIFAYTTGQSSAGNGNVLTMAAGSALGATNNNGGNLIIAAGNGDGSGTDGNVIITAGSSTNIGDVTIEANNWNATVLGELNINTDPGASGEVLTSQGAGNPPIWSAAAGSTAPRQISKYTALRGF
jgi:hypothetical protein